MNKLRNIRFFYKLEIVFATTFNLVTRNLIANFVKILGIFKDFAENLVKLIWAIINLTLIKSWTFCVDFL